MSHGTLHAESFHQATPKATTLFLQKTKLDSDVFRELESILPKIEVPSNQETHIPSKQSTKFLRTYNLFSKTKHLVVEALTSWHGPIGPYKQRLASDRKETCFQASYDKMFLSRLEPHKVDKASYQAGPIQHQETHCVHMCSLNIPKPLLHQSGNVTVLAHWRLVGLRARRVPSSVALKVTPCAQPGQETTSEGMLKFS